MATERRQYAIAQLATGEGVEEAMKRFNVDRRTVNRAIQAYKQALEKDPYSIIGHWLFQVRAVHKR
jgi:transposase